MMAATRVRILHVRNLAVICVIIKVEQKETFSIVECQLTMSVLKMKRDFAIRKQLIFL